MFLFYSAFIINLSYGDCITYDSPLRTQNYSCWVKFHLDHRRQICIDHPTWIQWLNHPFPNPICEDPHFQWKPYSPLVNSINSAKTPHKQKEVFLKQTLKHWHFSKKSKNTKWQNYYIQIRKKIEIFREKASLFLAPYDPFGIFRSLILHEGTNQDKINMFRILGFVHLTSVSGIHLYAWLGTCNRAIRFLCFWAQVSVSIGIWIRRMTGLLTCLFIWILTGCKFGLLRPGWIILLRHFAELFGLRWRKLSPLFLALAIDVLLESRGSKNNGRWYYAFAIGGGLIWYPCFRSIHLGLAIGSWIGVVIFEIWHTGLIALATPILSLITLPIICIWIYPITFFSLLLHLFGIPFFSEKIIHSAAMVLNYLFLKLTKLAMFPGNLWMIPKWALLIGFIISMFIVALDIRLDKNWKLIAGIIGIVLIIRMIQLNSNIKGHEFARTIYQLDVGQGDSALVIGQTAGLIDTGSLYSLSDSAWIEILAKNKIQKLSWIGLTHLDEDHSGGLLRLARLIPIHCVSIPQAELQINKREHYLNNLRNLNLRIYDWSSSCIPYATLALGPSTLRTSNPKRFIKNQANQNMGAVLIPTQDGGFYLAAGDASAQAEIIIGIWLNNLIKKSGSKTLPQNRILKISHHGSKTSSSRKFLELVRPSQAWISVGQNNRYGHPSFSVLKTLESLKIPVLRTDQSGILKF